MSYLAESYDAALRENVEQAARIAVLVAENARLNSENEMLTRAVVLGMDAVSVGAALTPAPAREDER